MKFGVVVFLLFIMMINSISTHHKEPPCRQDFCHTVKCISTPKENCTIDQVFQPRDETKCICCDKCIPKQDCDPTFCSRVRCINKNESDCTNDEVFQPRDETKCICCNTCVPKKDIHAL
ncbi:uncharacterized protein [Onthophagus taurus]|uniref:uncharacterized protein n=1 Tax=Onthophagus taurus TaxID=166361 RepID=UPI0039BDA427